MNKHKKQQIIEEPEDFSQWYLSAISKVAFVFIAFHLFLKRTWVGEDAFIFFRYVDNLVHGNGLVFNLGERVEGFTAPLWVLVLAFLRKILGFELRPTSIILGLILSTAAIALLIYFEHNHKIFFPLVVTLLVTTSAFRDFATSGFETSLTYLLLISALICIKREIHFAKPEVVGILLSLLVLNRPESVLVLFYVGILVLLKKDLKTVTRFFIPVILLVGGYQIFRMGYFASLLPNTFYAKKGGALYFSQGLNYLRDFIYSYPLTTSIYTALTIYAVANKRLRLKTWKLFIIPVLLTGYVLYAGGDYMHGRSLLIAFIAWSFVLIEPSYDLVRIYSDKVKSNGFALQVMVLAIVFIVGFLGTKQVSYTTRAQKAVRNIEDERSRFGYSFKPGEFKEYLMLPITNELGWSARGLYYREISERLQVPFSVVNGNIGYFGYAVGENVNVMSGVLIDPYLARLDIAQRGKIGHENALPIEYVLSRRPTFSYTPFKYWNVNAHFKWDSARFADAIVGDSNDSFIPIFDLSQKEFLEKFSILTGHTIKSEIDGAQRNFLLSLKKDNLNTFKFDVLDYLGFLKTYWYPYADDADRKIFDNQSQLVGWVAGKSAYEKFEPDQNRVWDRVKNPMSFDRFMLNISYSIKSR